MQRNTLKLIIIFLLVLIIILSAFIVYKLIQEGETDQTSHAQQDISLTLDALLGRNDAEEIYLSGVFLGGNSFQMLSNSEIGTLISERITYKIEEILIRNDQGEVKIHIIFPDIYNLLTKVVEENPSLTNTDELLQCLQKSLVTYPSTEKTFVCSLNYTNNHWYINPSEELLNSLSGNLYGYYINLGTEYVNNISGGNN